MAQTDASIFPLEFLKKKTDSQKINPYFSLVIKKLFRFKNSFEIRDLHYFASKNVPHTISQILRVTEIEQFRWNQLLTKNQ